MTIDKKTLNALLNLPDDKLMQMLKIVVGGDIPLKDVSPSTVAGLRNVLGKVTDDDISRALELLSLYKNGKRT